MVYCKLDILLKMVSCKVTTVAHDDNRKHSMRFYYDICQMNNSTNVTGPKFVSFWKVWNMLFCVGRVLQNSPHQVGEFGTHSCSHPICFDVTPILVGLRYHEHFRGPVILTHHHFWTHVQYCITFYYYICHIEKYTYVEVLHINNLEGLQYGFLNQKGFVAVSQNVGRH